MTTETKGLHEERLKHINDARAILEIAEKDSRELNKEEHEKYDKFFDAAESLKKRIDILEKQAEAERVDVNKSAPVENDDKSSSEKFSQRDMDKAITKKFDHGYDSLDSKEKNALSQYEKEEAVFWKNLTTGYESLDVDEKQIYADVIQSRQQATTPGAKGGFLVPKQFQLELDKALLAFGGMREASRIIKSAKGGTLDWPTVDDTTNTGRWLGENTVVTDTDITFGQVQFSDFTRSSDMIKVSLQLMTDSAFDLPSFLRDALADRIGRGSNESYTNGDGVSKPTGVIQGSKIGVTAASATAITANELIDLFHSVNSAYRKSPKAWWMFNDLTLKAIRKLVDSNGQFVWQPGLRAGEPDILLGKRFIINDDIPDIALNKKSILFGDFSKFIIRDIGSFILLRLDERFADNLQVGFTGFLRTDSKIIDAGTGPIKHLRHPNT